ncbi:beta-lactamase family protein [Fulvivirga maritima]|uniref:serine hydrolase domain-containing protein n=1 Tax=Fulvivirga maritima TaxID=2904247 RepID=UPI001F39B2AA|nr:serine hydrolase [Fulvivirga maritima]UII25263.1 beta-lactamase family protein [Fulvivirga maritima]
MFRIFKAIIFIMVMVLLIFGASYLWRALPIISGYGAKNLCSCVYVSDRLPESVVGQELGNFPLSLGTYEVDKSDSSAYGSVFGIAKRKAIYRKGIGCTLISEISEDEVRGQDLDIPKHKVLPDSLIWPIGNATVYADSNMDLEALHQVLEEAFEETDPDKPKNTRAVVVVHQGKIVAEKYAPGFQIGTPQLGWSMTKSITNALVGMLVKDGKLDIYESAPLASWSGSDPRRKITIDHLLRMSSGLEWEENYAGPSTATTMLFRKENMGAYAASFPLEKQPDEEWYYSSGTSNIISMIVRDTAGKDYYDFVHNRLFNKIGMTSAVIEPDASGTFVGSSYMYATPRDWAKFGLLYLNDGVWQGERILPEGWVNYSSTASATAKEGNYGAHFWTNADPEGKPGERFYPSAPANMYSMNGFEGQRVFILPSQDMVIVRMGQNKRGNFDFDALLKGTLAALKEN